MKDRAVRASAGRTNRECPCCQDEQAPKVSGKRHHSPDSATPPQKRRRSMAAHPNQPLVVTSAPAQCTTQVERLISKPPATIHPADLPAVCHMPILNQSSTAAVQDNEPLMIYTVEEYQQIYHEVVDDMLRFKNGRRRPYSVNLGRGIKQKLWERMNKPSITTLASQNGLINENITYGYGKNPPLYILDD